MRAAFSDALVRLASTDPRVILLTGDHGYALFDEFRQHFSSQYVNVGIAEQNMVGVAAGLAKTGFRPIVYGLSAFVPIRVVEQIKLDIAHDNLPVILVGDGAGFVYSHLGSSHQSMEDIACTRAIPGLSILSPGDRHEMRMCMNRAYALNSSVYVRIGKADLGDIHQAPLSDSREIILVKLGKLGDVAFVATGSMVRTAQQLAEHSFPNASVWSVPILKPFGEAAMSTICRNSTAIVTFEEHSIFGGLGSAVAEISSALAPVPVLRVGVADRFSEFCGTYQYLLAEHGLDPAAIEIRVRAFLSRAIPSQR